MSSGGRLILVNSCLSSIPTYIMSFYHLTDGHHGELDTIRRRLFWQGGSKTHKYHIAKWERITVPKEFGGLGIIDTRRMNDYLLNKWVWKIVIHDQSLWCRILYEKYMKKCDFFSSRSVGGSQFWKGLHKVKHLFKWGAVHKVGRGDQTKFWTDVWLDRVPLKVSFQELFKICSDPDALVMNLVVGGEWRLEFRRELDVQQMALLGVLEGKLEVVNIDKIEDTIS
jgi:hypothetical protein